MTTRAVRAANAVYQNVDMARLMDRVLALSRNNILGAFPGSNPFGFQADPSTFCLFAVPVTRPLAGAPAGAPASGAGLDSFVAANSVSGGGGAAPAAPASGLDAFLGGGALGALGNLPAGLNSFAATQRRAGAGSGSGAGAAPGVTTAPVTTLEANGISYACTPYEAVAASHAGAPAPAEAAGAAAAAAPAPGLAAAGRRLAAAAGPDPGPYPSPAAPPAALGTGQLPAPPGANAAALAGAPAAAPAGGYGGDGKRAPLAYYNPKTGGVTIQPPVELFTAFGKRVDSLLSGHTGNPFFDCVSTGASATPFKDFVSIASKDAQVLSSHFKSYLQARPAPPLPPVRAVGTPRRAAPGRRGSTARSRRGVCGLARGHCAPSESIVPAAHCRAACHASAERPCSFRDVRQPAAAACCDGRVRRAAGPPRRRQSPAHRRSPARTQGDQVLRAAAQGDYHTPGGGLAIKNLSVYNPFDPNAKPINLRFSAERPSFSLPQARRPAAPSARAPSRPARPGRAVHALGTKARVRPAGWGLFCHAGLCMHGPWVLRSRAGSRTSAVPALRGAALSTPIVPGCPVRWQASGVCGDERVRARRVASRACPGRAARAAAARRRAARGRGAPRPAACPRAPDRRAPAPAPARWLRSRSCRRTARRKRRAAAAAAATAAATAAAATGAAATTAAAARR